MEQKSSRSYFKRKLNNGTYIFNVGQKWFDRRTGTDGLIERHHGAWWNGKILMNYVEKSQNFVSKISGCEIKFDEFCSNYA